MRIRPQTLALSAALAAALSLFIISCGEGEAISLDYNEMMTLTENEGAIQTFVNKCFGANAVEDDPECPSQAKDEPPPPPPPSSDSGSSGDPSSDSGSGTPSSNSGSNPSSNSGSGASSSSQASTGSSSSSASNTDSSSSTTSSSSTASSSSAASSSSVASSSSSTPAPSSSSSTPAPSSSSSAGTTVSSSSSATVTPPVGGNPTSLTSTQVSFPKGTYTVSIDKGNTPSFRCYRNPGKDGAEKVGEYTPAGGTKVDLEMGSWQTQTNAISFGSETSATFNILVDNVECKVTY